MFKFLFLFLFVIGCSEPNKEEKYQCEPVVKAQEVDKKQLEEVINLIKDIEFDEAIAACPIDSMHDHVVDAKSGISPKQCNGYTFNITHIEHRKDFDLSYKRHFPPKWGRFDKHCHKVQILNAPGDATHVCNGNYSNGSPIVEIFVKVEKVTIPD